MVVIETIPNTNVHHVHGTIVTGNGRPNRQNNIMFTIKGHKQVRLTRAQNWVKQLAKLKEGFPIHLVDQAEHLCFKEVLLPTYKDYAVPAPYLSCMLTWEGLELYVLPGFLGNAVSREGKVYELYVDTRAKEWYWAEVYPNQNECYDLINSIDGDMLELSVEDIVYLMKSDIVTTQQVKDFYEKRSVDRKAELALEDGWVTIDPEEAVHVESFGYLEKDNVVVELNPRPKTAVEAFLQAYRNSSQESVDWTSRLVV
ncbi:hypothetical protein [Vibrio phage pTD1]|uniref:Uncharacterized protein n=1 Tax=Vibrio phage pTD1 TaxID=1938577 RepID=A0A1Q2U318_9CAUD|nr:hypothetical protein FDH33_gp143 [Vibrio phage pTD1]BAW98352.1 hypothetical protein [Vibrio phage pTD1]